MESEHCHICYQFEEEMLICDFCDTMYCLDCSYSYTYHFTYEGSLCYFCSNQNRREPLTYSDIRDNKIKLLLYVKENHQNI